MFHIVGCGVGVHKPSTTLSMTNVEVLGGSIFLYFIFYISFILGNPAYSLFLLSPRNSVQLTASQSDHFWLRYGHLNCLVPWEDIFCIV